MVMAYRIAKRKFARSRKEIMSGRGALLYGGRWNSPGRPVAYASQSLSLATLEVSVHLTMSGPLPYSEGEATFRFPLVVAPRYMPGSALSGQQVGDGTSHDTDAVPDARAAARSAISPWDSAVRLIMGTSSGTAASPFSQMISHD